MTPCLNTLTPSPSAQQTAQHWVEALVSDSPPLHGRTQLSEKWCCFSSSSSYLLKWKHRKQFFFYHSCLVQSGIYFPHRVMSSHVLSLNRTIILTFVHVQMCMATASVGVFIFKHGISNTYFSFPLRTFPAQLEVDFIFSKSQCSALQGIYFSSSGRLNV